MRQRGPLDRALPWAIFAAGYLAAFFVSTAVPTRLLWYLPLERRFVYAVWPVELAVDLYGRVFLSLLVGGLSALATRLALGFVEPRAEWLRAALVWTLGLLVFTAGMYVWVLAFREPIPAPLPHGYVAR